MSNTDFFDDDLARVKPKTGPVLSALSSDTVLDRGDSDASTVPSINLTRLAKHREEMTTQAAGAMKEIERLRRRQEELEREKQTLEDMAHKEGEFERSRREMLDRFQQSIALFEKQEVQAARMTELYAVTRQRFKAMLHEVESIDESKWPEDNIREELNKALVLIDDARKEYHKALATIDASGGASGGTLELPAMSFEPATRQASSPRTGFGYWIKVGVAVTLPLILVIIVLVATYFVLRANNVL